MCSRFKTPRYRSNQLLHEHHSIKLTAAHSYQMVSDVLCHVKCSDELQKHSKTKAREKKGARDLSQKT